MVVLQRDPAAGTDLVGDRGHDVVALLHTYPGTSHTLDGVSGEVRHDAEVGSLVRVRIANTDSSPTVAWASAPFRLLAIGAGHA